MPRLVPCALLVFAGVLRAAEPSPDALAFFETKVRPLLVERCYECHTEGKKTKGGLALDSRPGWQEGGDLGPVIVPGKPDDSLLYKAIGYDDKDLQMPPKQKLPDSEIAVLRQWIALGAPDPRDAGAVAAKARPAGLSVEEGRKFWAFVPPGPQTPPQVKDAAWPRGAIDRFLLAKLESKQFSPASDADAYTLFRRLSIDLTGLPPTVEELAAFAGNASEAVFAAAVDRMLASPAFGDRWGRHWLDLAQYADNVSVDRLFPDPGAWRYRDYVVRAFNEDKPFNEFVREQIAGDLLPARDERDRAEKIVATAFLTQVPIQVINQYKDQLRWDIVNLQVAKIGQALLGQTLQCARCHDHKFDPVPQRDYYALAGILQNVPVLNGLIGKSKVFSDVVRVDLPVLLEDQIALAAAAEEFARKKLELEAEVDARKAAVAAAQKALAALDKKPAPAGGAREPESAVSEPEPDLAARRTQLKAALEKARAAQTKAGADLKNHTMANEPRAPQIVAASEPAKATNARITIRGQASQLGGEVPRGFLQVASVTPPPVIPADASGRRQLADWLVDPRHPLVARVFVNRVWHHLFGDGLVRSVDYFGVRGEAPTHPELLDWLALRFITQGWSVKALVREIVLSRAYRMTAKPSPQTAQAAVEDPDNRLLWRANRRRLSAEAFRDSVLALSGQLDPVRGGPCVPTLSYSGGPIGDYSVIKGDGAPEPHIASRRSLYLPAYRRAETWAAGLRLMDAPLPAEVVGARAVTTVPTQALFLLNSELTIKAGREAARRLLAGEPASDDQRVRKFYLAALSRPANDAEVRAALDFIAGDGSASRENAWAQFCHAILVSNEFLFYL